MLTDPKIGQYDFYPTLCPLCHCYITPNKIYSEKDNDIARIVYKCTNPSCCEIFIAHYNYSNNHSRYNLSKTLPKNYVATIFDKEIGDISPEFVEVYNQALRAETFNLDKIAGVGFRKSLEFLIKDYLIALNPNDADAIKSESLGKTINDRIADGEIKEISKRAVRIGNDETHYVKKWEEKDIKDLKILIDIVQSFISKKEKSRKYLTEMN